MGDAVPGEPRDLLAAEGLENRGLAVLVIMRISDNQNHVPAEEFFFEALGKLGEVGVREVGDEERKKVAAAS